MNLLNNDEIKNLCELLGIEHTVPRELTEKEKLIVKQLRKETGYGLMDCKCALLRCNFDYEKAREFLGEKRFGIFG